ncbi:MAG: hypothetical protein JW760_12120, partial [Spirochaetales bacterium]|nr:hypothetical protein [Spirochaetales bacterium]
AEELEEAEEAVEELHIFIDEEEAELEMVSGGTAILGTTGYRGFDRIYRPPSRTTPPGPSEFEKAEPPLETEETEQEITDVFPALKKKGIVEILEGRRFFTPKEDGVIDLSGGVYKVRDTVLLSSPEGKDQEFKELVESVISEEKETGGIDELFGDLSLDLGIESPEEAEEKLIAEASPEETEEVSEEKTGFNYDDFMSGSFRKDEVGVVKSLMRLSQRVDSLAAVILIQKEDLYTPLNSVGLDHEGLSRLSFPKDSKVFLNVLAKRRIFLVKRLRTGEKELDRLVSDNAKAVLKSIFFVPAIYDGKAAYLFFGFKNRIQSIESVIPRLNDMNTSE